MFVRRGADQDWFIDNSRPLGDKPLLRIESLSEVDKQTETLLETLKKAQPNLNSVISSNICPFIPKSFHIEHNLSHLFFPCQWSSFPEAIVLVSSNHYLSLLPHDCASLLCPESNELFPCMGWLALDIFHPSAYKTRYMEASSAAASVNNYRWLQFGHVGNAARSVDVDKAPELLSLCFTPATSYNKQFLIMRVVKATKHRLQFETFEKLSHTTATAKDNFQVSRQFFNFKVCVWFSSPKWKRYVILRPSFPFNFFWSENNLNLVTPIHPTLMKRRRFVSFRWKIIPSFSQCFENGVYWCLTGRMIVGGFDNKKNWIVVVSYQGLYGWHVSVGRF